MKRSGADAHLENPMQIAQTPVVLFTQMREQGRSAADIALVQRAYDLNVELYSGRFEADGSPFQVHGLGTASIVCQLGLPTWLVAAACVHNAYDTGDFGDGRGRGTFPHRRALVRSRIGDDAEAFVKDLYGNRIDRKSITALLDRDTPIPERERLLVIHDLADLLEKWFDGGFRYTRPDRRDRKFVSGHEDQIVVLADRLGYRELATAMRDAFARFPSDETNAPQGWDRTYSQIIRPRSLTTRFAVRILGLRWTLYRTIKRTAKQMVR